MTYLELINEVLVRLREPEVTTISGKYARLIGAMVNDGKRAVEDAADWSQLQNTITVVTNSGTSDYALTDTNERSTIYSVINDNSKARLQRSTARELIEAKQIYADTSMPAEWAVVGQDSNGQLNLRLYPTPNGAYDISVNAYIPDGDLVNGTDTLTVPSEPVFRYAYAMAIKERGEDNGASYREAMDTYRRVLSRYLALNGASQGPKQWQVL